MAKNLTRYLLRSLLFSAVGTVAYLAVFYLTFPSDAIRARLVSEARKANVDLRMGDVHPHGLTGTGLHFDGLSVAMIDAPRKSRRRSKQIEEEEGAPTPAPAPEKQPFLNFDSLVVDVAPLPLLRSGDDRTVDLDIEADAYGGEVEGQLFRDKAHTVVNLQGTNLELARYPIVGADFKIDAVGLVNFKTDLDLSAEDYKTSTGSVAMDIQGMRILKSSTVSQMPLPVELLFTEAILRITVAEGKGQLDALRLISNGVAVEGDGEIFLASELSRARLKLKVRIKPGDDLQILSAVLPSRARSDDGWYHYMVTGLITDPRFRPDAGAARRWNKDHGGGEVSTPAGDVMPPEIVDEGDEEDGEPRVTRRVARPSMPSIDKSGVPAPNVSDDERDRRREERMRLAEERRKRREERLAKIREAQERGGEPFMEHDGELMAPPFPGDAEMPFRPGTRREIPAPLPAEEEGYAPEEPINPEPLDEAHELAGPEVEIVPEGEYEEPPPPEELMEPPPEGDEGPMPMDGEER